MQEAEAIIQALFDDAQDTTSDTILAAVRGRRVPAVTIDYQRGQPVGVLPVRQDITPGVTAAFPRNRPSKAVRRAFNRRHDG